MQDDLSWDQLELERVHLQLAHQEVFKRFFVIYSIDGLFLHNSTCFANSDLPSLGLGFRIGFPINQGIFVHINPVHGI